MGGQAPRSPMSILLDLAIMARLMNDHLSLRAGGFMPDGNASRSDISLTLPITGMTCASCATRVEKAIKAVPGVLTANVNAATGHAHVSLDRNGRSIAVAEAVRKAGYQ